MFFSQTTRVSHHDAVGCTPPAAVLPNVTRQHGDLLRSSRPTCPRAVCVVADEKKPAAQVGNSV